MLTASFPVIAAWTNVAVFAFAGFVNLVAFGFVRRAYERWDIPVGFYRALGVVEIIAAAFLATPGFRLLGIALAAPILFGSVVMLLDHRHYVYAVSAMLVMTTLIAAAAAVPQQRFQIGYATELSSVQPSGIAITGQLSSEPVVVASRNN